MTTRIAKAQRVDDTLVFETCSEWPCECPTEDKLNTHKEFTFTALPPKHPVDEEGNALHLQEDGSPTPEITEDEWLEICAEEVRRLVDPLEPQTQEFPHLIGT